MIAAFFLIRDPYHVANVRNAVRARTYFLDTNVYLSWFYASQTPHKTIKPLMELMLRYGVKLSVLRETVEEIERIEAEARSAARKAEGNSALAEYLVRGHKAIFADYWHMKSSDRQLTFSTFERLFMGVERILAIHGVDIVNIKYAPDEDFPGLRPTFRNAIKGAKMDGGRIIREEAVDHDADALLAISKLQLRGERDEWGAKTRFLSLDGMLNGAIQEIRNAVRRRLEPVDSPFALARLLLTADAVNLDRSLYEEYVINCVQQNLGLLTEMRGYGDVDLIQKLDRAGLPIRTLLQVPGRLLESALSDLQGRRDLSRKLDQALAAPDAESREPLVKDIARDLSEALAFRSDLLRQTETRLEEEQRDKATALEELNQVKAQLEQLTAQLNAVREAQELIGSEFSGLQGRHRRLRRWLTLGTLVLLLGLVALVAIRIVRG